MDAMSHGESWNRAPGAKIRWCFGGFLEVHRLIERLVQVHFGWWYDLQELTLIWVVNTLCFHGALVILKKCLLSHFSWWHAALLDELISVLLVLWSGWWFGCHFLFSHILGIIIPIDFHIFQRGGPTTNQMMYYPHFGGTKCPFHPCSAGRALRNWIEHHH